MQRVFQESTELKFVWWFIGQCIYFLSLHPKRIHSEGIKPSFSDKTNGLQLLKPYTRVLVLLTYLTKRTYSICFKFRGVFLCDFVEFQFLQAHSRLEIGGITKSVRESCLVTEKHIGFHHFSQHSLAVMVSFNSSNPDIHDSFFLAQQGTDFLIDFAEKMLFQFDDRGDKVQIFHVVLIETQGNVCQVLCYADPHHFVISLRIEASDRDSICRKFVSEKSPQMLPLFYLLAVLEGVRLVIGIGEGLAL